MSDEIITVTTGSGNVYEDLGIPDPEGMQLKSNIVWIIRDAMDLAKVSESDLAKMINYKEEDIISIFRGHFQDLNPNELLTWLNPLINILGRKS